jgi:hypothetical protein
MSGANEIPVVQLPIDLQNEIRSTEGSFATGALVGGMRELGQIVALLAASAAVGYALAAAVSDLSGPFAVPSRWLMLIGGATIAGLIVGEHARLDIRPHGLTKWIVGSTSLVRVERDLVHVFPAERIEHVGSDLRLVSPDGSEVVIDAAHLLPLQEIAGAQAAARDPVARAADRWRAAAIGRPAPIRRWTPALHGAGLGLTLAIAIEASTSSSATQWNEVAARAAHVHEALVAQDARHDDQRLADAKRRGETALHELSKAARDEDKDKLADRAEALRAGIIEGQLAAASLDRLYAWYKDKPRLSGTLRERIVNAYSARLGAEAPVMDYATLYRCLQQANELHANRDPALPRLDELFAAEVAGRPDLEQAANQLNELAVDLAALPRTVEALAAIAEKASADAAATLEDVAQAERFLQHKPETIRTAYQRACRRELRVATIETIDALARRAAKYGAGSEGEIAARADKLFLAALYQARTPQDLDALTVPDIVGHQGKALIMTRGKSLAQQARSLDDQIEWISWLADDPLAPRLHRQVVASGMSGGIALVRATLAALRREETQNADIAARFDDDEAGLEHRIENLCHDLFPPASLGRDLARHLAAQLCWRTGRVVTFYGREHEEAIAAQYTRRAVALLGAAGAPSEVKPSHPGAELYIEYNFDEVTIGDRAMSETFACKLRNEDNWTCTLEDP